MTCRHTSRSRPCGRTTRAMRHTSLRPLTPATTPLWPPRRRAQDQLSACRSLPHRRTSHRRPTRPCRRTPRHPQLALTRHRRRTPHPPQLRLFPRMHRRQQRSVQRRSRRSRPRTPSLPLSHLRLCSSPSSRTSTKRSSALSRMSAPRTLALQAALRVRRRNTAVHTATNASTGRAASASTSIRTQALSVSVSFVPIAEEPRAHDHA